MNLFRTGRFWLTTLICFFVVNLNADTIEENSDSGEMFSAVVKNVRVNNYVTLSGKDFDAFTRDFSARVQKIIKDNLVDVVVLDAGLRQGFRIGTICQAEDAEGVYAELVVVETDFESSIALIVDGRPQTDLSVNDIVQVKFQK